MFGNIVVLVPFQINMSRVPGCIHHPGTLLDSSFSCFRHFFSLFFIGLGVRVCVWMDCLTYKLGELWSKYRV